MKCIGKIKVSISRGAMSMAFMVIFLTLYSCGNKEAMVGPDSAGDAESVFFADNDIAMTVCSIVDAVRVGEPLDSTGYNFNGILTDGQGTPLYTDVEGNPGEWSVKVVGREEAMIKNLFLGDLMTDDLRHYIVSSLNLNSADLVTAYENPLNEGEMIFLYDIGDVKVSFSTIEAETPSGLEGLIMAIRVFR